MRMMCIIISHRFEERGGVDTENNVSYPRKDGILLARKLCLTHVL